MSRRPALTACLLVAFLVGGVGQAWLWRLGVEPLSAVVNSQFAWALILYLAGWVAGSTRLGHGTLAGALTGSVLIGSYYLCQALADGPGSAVSQFTKSHGPAWVIATMLVGGVLGLLGAGTAQTVRRPVVGSFASVTIALFLLSGPTALVMLYGAQFLAVDRVAVPAAFGTVGVLLAVLAIRRAPGWAVLRGGILALGACVAGVGILSLLMTRVLYLTF
jgi:hypothetical protein